MQEKHVSGVRMSAREAESALRSALPEGHLIAEGMRGSGPARGPTLADANPLREALARKIIELAKAGERDPERLCEGALRDLPPVVSAS
jgi:hypothetical protein